MLKMRLQRTGRKNDPSFRIVVVEGTEGPRTGNHIDLVGFYNAVTKEKRVDGEKAKQWIQKGAQPSDTVFNMLVSEGIIEGKKRNALPKKTPIVKEAPADLPAEASVQAGEAKAEAPTEPAEVASEAPTETPAPEATPAEEAPKEETPAETPAEAPAEEPKEEAPAA